MSWIDSHVHLWTQNTVRYPVVRGSDVSNYEPKEFTPEILFRYARPSKVYRAVLVHIGIYGKDLGLMLDALYRYPDVFRIVGMVDPENPSVADDMKGCLESGVTGFRIVATSDDASNWLQLPGYNTIFRTAAQTGQAICPLVHPSGIPEISRMCGEYPDTVVVLDHMARIGEREAVSEYNINQLCTLSRHPNVYVKISKLHALGIGPPHNDLIPMIMRVIDAFGSERVMWGSDSPYQVTKETYEDSISVVRDRLGLSESERDQILAGTADKVFWR